MLKDNLIFGFNPIIQLLETNPNRIKDISIASNKKDTRSKRVQQLAQDNDIHIHNIDVSKIDALLGMHNHQGIIAKITPTPILTEADLSTLIENNNNPLFLILDGVQDPHNFGACLRTADCAGVTAVITPKDNAVGITPVVRKVASGAADLIPIVQVTNLARSMRTIQEQGVWIVGTSLDTEQSLYDVDLSGAIAIVLGSEGQGIRNLTAKHCDYLVKLPLLGGTESLNVSVATGICLYEAVRQRLGD